MDIFFKDSLFFFSSRRRHTRLQGDWSSDVCSSDLAGRSSGASSSCTRTRTSPPAGCPRWSPSTTRRPARRKRSEERRVGKEGGGWGVEVDETLAERSNGVSELFKAMIESK